MSVRLLSKHLQNLNYLNFILLFTSFYIAFLVILEINSTYPIHFHCLKKSSQHYLLLKDIRLSKWWHNFNFSGELSLSAPDHVVWMGYWECLCHHDICAFIRSVGLKHYCRCTHCINEKWSAVTNVCLRKRSGSGWSVQGISWYGCVCVF